MSKDSISFDSMYVTMMTDNNEINNRFILK